VYPANPKFARDAWLRALARTKSIDELGITLPMLVDRWAALRTDSPALIADGESLTYAELAGRCNQYARWGLAQGLKAGDVVSLVMPNCADYLAVWLGLTRIGVTVALANTHLTGDLLAHAVCSVEPRLVIAAAALAPALGAARARLAPGRVRVRGASGLDLAPIDAELAQAGSAPLRESECAAPSLDATALYIYTSGTTGLPKAARVSHYRVMQWSHWFAGLTDTVPADRMYDCLPLYHSVGGVVATGATLVGGGAVVIRARFSASDFWRDVTAERCTLFQYIGELCRYLVNAPQREEETRHALRLACGNGLRPEVWEAFRTRFRIPHILEYYAATEANFSLYNCEGEPGAIGRIPPFLAHRLPVALLRFDVARGEPLRNAAGRCERCATDEVGEAVGRLPQAGRGGRFEGYAEREASDRKVLRDVFEPGDAWYRSGDLMRRDARGFYYFVDRVGETYRWKGENVSTTEVQAVLLQAPGVRDGVVYGVSVPGADGRAGMAALIVDPDFDPAAFAAHVGGRLPAYARPVFLRLLPALAATGTFKPIKQELQGAAFDPAVVSDPLYVDLAGAPGERRYVPLDAALYRSILGGAVRL
jgi:fatty-acyl-CoA synthase